MRITREELVEGIKALSPEEKTELLNGLRMYLKSIADEASIAIDSFVYGMTRFASYEAVAKRLGVSYGIVNASVTRTKMRNKLILNEEPESDPSICTKCGLTVSDDDTPVIYAGLSTHRECADRRGHRMTMKVTATWNSVLAFCECDWNPQTVFRSWMMAKRAHYTYVKTKADLIKMATEGM